MMYLAISNLFLVFLGIGLVIPVIPQIKDEMNFSGTTMGMMISIFAIMQLLSSPISGTLSDKIGRKKLIVLGMIIFSISELLFGLGTSKLTFYVSRGLGGIAAALIMPSVTAFVADMTSLRERSKEMGLVSAAISGGFIIGPSVGGLLAYFGTRAPFFAASFLGLIGFILSLVVLREPQKHMSVAHETDVKSSIIMTLKKPIFASLFLIILISSFGLQAFESIYAIMVKSNFSFSTSEIAIVITISGIIALSGTIDMNNNKVIREIQLTKSLTWINIKTEDKIALGQFYKEYNIDEEIVDYSLDKNERAHLDYDQVTNTFVLIFNGSRY